MEIKFAGIHHVTAIAGDPQENLDFYAGILGLRLVKKTVNFDDPSTYHLYYGDTTGNPGTIMTFFTWPGAVRGRVGSGQVSATSFAVPEDSLGYWTERLVEHGVRFGKPQRRFDETVLSFVDGDGLPVEIVARPGATEGGEPWPESPVPPEHAVCRISGVTLSERSREKTVGLLTDFQGFEKVGEEDGRTRYAAGESFADVLEAQSARGVEAVGTVHHVAWRAPDEETLEAWRGEVGGRGFNVTPVLDRKYFRSIYFREPGGVLFEIATDRPGFPVDEPVEELGTNLKLPPWLEEQRPSIEVSLPPVTLPHQKGQQDAPKDLGFAHRFVPGTDGDPNTLLLLHGTGGDENDLLPLGRMLSEGAALLSPRGKVMENGMPRFFRRLAMGVFDEEDLKQRTHELAGFIEGAAGEYGLDPGGIWAVGFSNGANIAASLLLMYPRLLTGAVLLRAMVPFESVETAPDLSGVPVYLAAGQADAMIPAENTERLANLLQTAGADVTLDWQPGGHGIGRTEVEAARRWLAQTLAKTG